MLAGMIANMPSAELHSLKGKSGDAGRLWVRDTHGMADAAGVLLLSTITCCFFLDAGTPCPALKSRGGNAMAYVYAYQRSLGKNVHCFKEIQGKNIQ